MELPGSPPSRGKQVRNSRVWGFSPRASTCSHAYSRPTPAKQANQSHVICSCLCVSVSHVIFNSHLLQLFTSTEFRLQCLSYLQSWPNVLGCFGKSTRTITHLFHYALLPLPPYNVDLNALYRCLRCQHCLEGVGYL